jgi:hypothetical protein
MHVRPRSQVAWALKRPRGGSGETLAVVYTPSPPYLSTTARGSRPGKVPPGGRRALVFQSFLAMGDLQPKRDYGPRSPACVEEHDSFGATVVGVACGRRGPGVLSWACYVVGQDLRIGQCGLRWQDGRQKVVLICDLGKQQRLLWDLISQVAGGQAAGSSASSAPSANANYHA